MVIGLLALNGAPAYAASPASCASSAKAAFARVQLYKDADCKGASVIVAKTGDANRPNFASFRNYDETIRNVDNSRSSLAIDAGTCVRLFDAVNYTGRASTNICAGSGVVFWNLDGFDDRATSMRVCPVSAPAQCNAAGAPAPAPAQAPLAGEEYYTLGTFNMAGGKEEHGVKLETADALSRSIKSRKADIVFLQEACANTTDQLQKELGNGWKVKFVSTERANGKQAFCKPEEKEIEFGIGIAYDSSRFTLARNKPFIKDLPSKGLEQRKIVCLDIATPRPIFACSTHLTDKDGNDRKEARTDQVKAIIRIVSPKVRSGRAVFVGGDFNTRPRASALDPLWHKCYGGGSEGRFVEVDSGPSWQRGPDFNRDPSGGDTDHNPVPWLLGNKRDYIFVAGVIVINGEVGKSKFSDHDPLWAQVYHSQLADPRCPSKADAR